MRFCAARGLRLNVIAVGTGEHDEYLAQLEAVAGEHDFRDRHWILQHAFFVEPEQARRYAALGFDVTTSMSFSWGKGDLFVERIGECVLPDLIPLRRLLDAGMTVACGTDWGPKNVFEHLALAMTHASAAAGAPTTAPPSASPGKRRSRCGRAPRPGCSAGTGSGPSRPGATRTCRSSTAIR